MDTPSLRPKYGRRAVFFILIVLCVGGVLLLSSVPSVSPPNINVLTKFAAARNSLLPSRAGIARWLSMMNNEPVELEATRNSDRQENQFIKRNNTILLIVGYLRTGSTFTASLFDEHPDSFYVFEPLHRLMHTLYSTGVLHYINGTVRHFENLGFNQEATMKAMQRWMTCDFANIDKESLKDPFHLNHGIDMKSFALCIRRRRFPRQLDNFVFKECIRPTARVCKQAPYRVFKTIRLRMPTAERLQSTIPNLKVIHLVRDPRGMFNSQTKTNKLLKKNDIDRMKKQCKDILGDIEVTTKLLKAKRDNIYTIRYEDIAYDPFGAAKNLYNFAGITLNSKIIDYINRSTSLNLKDNCPFCTRRSNSTKTANKWRTNIPSSLLDTIDKHCSEVYEKLGYFYLNKSMLRDTRKPSVTSIPLIDFLIQNG